VNVCSCDRFTTWTVAPMIFLICSANGFPVYPPSTRNDVTRDKAFLSCSTIVIAPALSVMLAVVIYMPCGSPCVSTAMCRLMPETFFPASYPFCCAVSVFFTLCASIMQKLVFLLRPWVVRASPIIFF